MAGLKQKQAELDDRLQRAEENVDTLHGEVKALWRCDEDDKELTKALIREALEKMHAEFADMKEEMDHKFNLQVAENKRLQGHISELKKENKHLHSEVTGLQIKVKGLEDEVMGM